MLELFAKSTDFFNSIIKQYLKVNIDAAYVAYVSKEVVYNGLISIT